MRKLILLFLTLTFMVACKSKSSPYSEEVQFLKGCYKEGRINKSQYQKLRSRAKSKWQ